MKTTEELEKLKQEIRNLKIENGKLATENAVLKEKLSDVSLNTRPKKEDQPTVEQPISISELSQRINEILKQNGEAHQTSSLKQEGSSFVLYLDPEHSSKLTYISGICKETPQQTLSGLIDKAYLISQIAIVNRDIFEKMGN